MTPIGQMLVAYQQKHDIDSKALAREIGLSESTLCRIRAGKMPDAQNLALIISWMVKDSV